MADLSLNEDQVSRWVVPTIMGAAVTSWALPLAVLLSIIGRQCAAGGVCSLSLFRYAPLMAACGAILSLAVPLPLMRRGRFRSAGFIAGTLLFVGFIFGVMMMTIITGI